MQAVSVVIALALAVISSCCWADEPQGTLKKIIDSKVIHLGYQKDLTPSPSLDPTASPRDTRSSCATA